MVRAHVEFWNCMTLHGSVQGARHAALGTEVHVTAWVQGRPDLFVLHIAWLHKQTQSSTKRHAADPWESKCACSLVGCQQSGGPTRLPPLGCACL